jgi:hypothetical protein
MRGAGYRVRNTWMPRTAFCVALAAAVVAFVAVASRDNASGDVGEPASTTVAPTASPPAGAPVIGSGTLGAGATWSVLAGGVGCFYPQIHVGTSTGQSGLCVRSPIEAQHLPWTMLSAGGSPVKVALVVARRGTRAIARREPQRSRRANVGARAPDLRAAARLRRVPRASPPAQPRFHRGDSQARLVARHATKPGLSRSRTSSRAKRFRV